MLEGGGLLVVGDIHLGKTAGGAGIHGGSDFIEMQFHQRPLRRAQNHKGDASARKVLLTAHIFVSGNKHVETAALRFGQQIAVGQFVPSSVFSLCDGVT